MEILPHLCHKNVALVFIDRETQYANYNGAVAMDSYHLAHSRY